MISKLSFFHGSDWIFIFFFNLKKLYFCVFLQENLFSKRWNSNRIFLSCPFGTWRKFWGCWFSFSVDDLLQKSFFQVGTFLYVLVYQGPGSFCEIFSIQFSINRKPSFWTLSKKFFEFFYTWKQLMKHFFQIY